MKTTNRRLVKRDSRKGALAAGLFGYTIIDGRMGSFKPMEGYLRDLEQMPHFAPPSPEKFTAQYRASARSKSAS